MIKEGCKRQTCGKHVAVSVILKYASPFVKIQGHPMLKRWITGKNAACHTFHYYYQITYRCQYMICDATCTHAVTVLES